ncbi:alcohol dehydrogenase catalytic domain-containing protein [Frankia tisae]|uniref:alcohol dehydrogenase catalytic domain-containing protein n=1 Tax=Frankia tisae TaxID=2950104 RepID=UPI0021C22CF4|nr:alcohol dehydrogenase catalytic domain-containing protein [Frankia tisae]
MSVGIASAVDTFATAELEIIPPGPRDVVVAVGASGICASDHSVLAGRLPFGLPLALGHELAGRVIEVRAVRDLTAGRGVDAAFEAAGRVDTTLAAYRMTRPAGTVVAVGAAEASAVLDLGAWEHVSSGRNFTSAVYGSADIDVDFPLLVRLAEAGRLNLDRLVSTRIGLSAADITAAFADTESVRTVIIP